MGLFSKKKVVPNDKGLLKAVNKRKKALDDIMDQTSGKKPSKRKQIEKAYGADVSER